MNIPLLHRPRFILIVSLFIACLLGWLFLGITEEVWVDQKLFFIDSALSQWMRDSQLPFASSLFMLLTEFGSFPVLLCVISITAVALIYHHRRMQALILIAGFLANHITVHVIKTVVGRTRPEPISVIEMTRAFPSGHSASSLFVYGFVGYLLSRQVKNRFYALGIMLACVMFAGLIGLSRLYLNVHWLSDVIGGFTLALAYLCLTIGWLEAHRRKNSFKNPA